MISLLVPKENEPDKNLKLDIEEELQRLMDTYGNDVLRTSYMYLKDKQKAEDAFQEVFIRVFKKYGSFRGESSEKTWIIKIAINVCKDILRSSWVKRVFLSDKVVSQKKSTGFEDGIARKDENRLLFNEVMSLQPMYKEVIILFYYQNFGTVEISSILNIAEGTVRSRLHRAREILKNKLVMINKIEF